MIRLVPPGLLVLLVLGCSAGMAADRTPGAAGTSTAGSPGGSSRSGSLHLQYERVVDPFTVLDADGTPYGHPFTGGFDVPRPQFVDIDGDGDLDLFVQERSDQLMFFENVGTPESYAFEWRTDRYRDLSIGEWYRFVDMDGDSLFDLIAEEPYSHIRLYANTGTRQEPEFVLRADTLRDSRGDPIFADRQNIANAADIDCDGLMDLFLGRIDGTITRYEETPTPANDGTPRFEFVTDRFEGIEIVAAFGSMHGANSMYFADHDDDGDLDLFWGDFFEAGVLLIRNQGTCPNPNLRGEPEPLRRADGQTILTSGYNVPVVEDIDADGDRDLFLGIIGGAFNPNRTAADNFHFYENTEAGYELRSTRFINAIDVGSESVVTAGDIDGDGDIDLLAGNKLDPATLQDGRLYVLENTGSAAAPRFALVDTLDLAPSYHYAPALADLDGDGLLDMLLGTWNDDVLYFRNAGTAAQADWVQDTTMTVRLPRGSNTTPALVDIDGDGDLDLFVGEADGTLNFYTNTGSATAPRFELEAESYDGIDVGRRSHPSFVDLDEDGDFDLVIGSENGGASIYWNEGTTQAPQFVHDETATLPLPPLANPVFVDLTGDGGLELLSGGLSGGVIYLQKSR